MREILFRGKRTDNGEWVEGFYGQFHNRPAIDRPNIHQIFVLFTEEEEKQNKGHFLSAIGGIWHTIIPETVGQYTGLTDKNGTKIFEGDIVSVAYNPKYTGISKDRIGNFEVVFNDGCFMKGSIRNNGLYHFIPSDETTVIGNIHDNPELRKAVVNNVAENRNRV